MLFNSFEFIIFFPLVLICTQVIPRKYKWVILLIASYTFYAFWKPSFLLLILLSTIIDFTCGIRMGQLPKEKRKLYLYLSILSNLGILFIFKYLYFFTSSANHFLSVFDTNLSFPLVELILPMGISFYTFQTLSYSIDVYKGEIQAEKHLGIFALYVVFFPQLVAGPIERARNLLPQLHSNCNHFNYTNVIVGLRLILWGFFKKIVVADRLAIFVNEIYNNPYDYEGLTLVIATIFFSFQIYCDFSGYSDIAIGAARVLGVKLMNNFDTPYFSKSISEFWKRWHISLSTWFKDYLYIPLGGNRVNKARWYYNIFITFLISGLWHGANWTFVIWGGIHGCLLVINSQFTHPTRKNSLKIVSLIRIVKTFIIVSLTWVFFRANSLTEALYILKNIFSFQAYEVSQLSLYVVPIEKNTVYSIDIFLGWVSIISLILIEYIGKRISINQLHIFFRWSFYILAIIAILIMGVHDKNAFIYFQF